MNRENDNKINVLELEKILGHSFCDRELLVRALTHSSYSNESGERNHHLLCNERLEFLGDSILSLVVSEYLFAKYPNIAEGELTCIRKEVVCAEALAKYARVLGLGEYLLLGIGETRNGGRDNENILAANGLINGHGAFAIGEVGDGGVAELSVQLGADMLCQMGVCVTGKDYDFLAM